MAMRPTPIRDLPWDDLDEIGEMIGQEVQLPPGSQRPDCKRDVAIFAERMLSLWSDGKQDEAARHTKAYVRGIDRECTNGSFARSCIESDFSYALAPRGQRPVVTDDLRALADRVVESYTNDGGIAENG